MGATNQEVGKFHEKIVGNTLKSWLIPRGYIITPQYRIEKPELRKHPIFTDSIRVDWLIRGVPHHETGVIVSVKVQNEPGQVVKVLYEHIDHAIKQVQPYPTVLYMTGKYYSDEIKKWATGEIDNKWLLKVFFDINDLSLWVQNLPDIREKNNSYEYEELALFRKCQKCGQYIYQNPHCPYCNQNGKSND